MLSTLEYIHLLRKYMRENAIKYGISRMGIFGSVARGEHHEGSDVDVCVEKLLKCPVDLIRLRSNMDEMLKNCINRDGIYV